MYNCISRLLMYGSMSEDEILVQLADVFRSFDEKSEDDARITERLYAQIKRLLKLATDYAFDDNLWHNYLTYLIINSENPFSITSEKSGAREGASVNEFVKNDFKVFMELFDFDFSEIEDRLSINCFTILQNYKAIVKPELMYNKNVSIKVRELSKKLASSKDVDEFFSHVCDFYRDYGVGMLGMNKAFRINRPYFAEYDNDAPVKDSGRDTITLFPIRNMDEVTLDDLVGIELQKEKLIGNTEAFVSGRPANNVLLFGDSGTGKSTCIKAIVNRYYDRGLRMIEIYKHQFRDIAGIIAAVKNRNYRFIIYMDDLSFEEDEVEYKFLKAVIEGGVETKPENVLIYATSNRRHLINETWKDRDDVTMSGGIHHSDTMEEKLSLVRRFGLTIGFNKPRQKEFFHIVRVLADRAGLDISDDELYAGANRWELMYGGISGRTARQYINHLLGMRE